MALSSNSLFHFTPKLDYLKDTIKNGIWARYCIEWQWENGLDFALPMCCFCDIPLSQVLNHMDSYGSSGIGVTKSWAKKYNITPVYYLDAQSVMREIMEQILREKKDKPTRKLSQIEYLFLSHMKKVEGNIIIKEKKKDSKRINIIEKKMPFYDEKEWRFVPDDNECIEVLERKESLIFDINTKSKTNLIRLPLTAEDISYIIVTREDSRSKMIQFIKDNVITKSDEEMNSLVSRIITKKQIKEDF